MRQMEYAQWAVRRAKAFRYRAENAVGHHVQRVDLPALCAGQHTATQPEEQHDVKRQLQLTGGKPQRRTGDKRALTAAGQDAVHAGAQQREHKADGEHIKHIRRFPLSHLCRAPVEQRHEEHTAKQAHIGGITGFKKSEGFDAAHAHDDVQQRQHQRARTWDVQARPALAEPDVGEQRTQRQQKGEGVAGEKVR